MKFFYKENIYLKNGRFILNSFTKSMLKYKLSMIGFEPRISCIENDLSTNSQCDQRKIAKCLLKLPKNDFTRKMIGFNTFTKIG